MALIRPFRGYRPRPDLVSEVCCPPYDILTSEEARQLARSNPHSFLRIIKPEVDFPPDTDMYADAVYEKAAENLNSFIRSGTLVRDPLPSVYLYRLRLGDHVQTGVVCAAAVDDYDSGTIKRHELTRYDREQDRTRFVNVQNGNTGPVFITYRGKRSITEAIESFCSSHPCSAEFTSPDTVTHTLWAVSDPDMIRTLREEFDHVRSLYIADGHHRAFAASKVREMRSSCRSVPDAEWNYFLAVIFPDTQLVIRDYNRVIKDMNGFSEQVFLRKLEPCFDVTSVSNGRPDGPRQFGLYMGGSWYRLRARPETYNTDDPVKSLDVSILHSNIISPLLGINNLKEDSRIEFVGGTYGLEALEKKASSVRGLAFALFPTTIEQIMKVSDAGEIMPPKSTWFYPKPYSGMAVHLF